MKINRWIGFAAATLIAFSLHAADKKTKQKSDEEKLAETEAKEAAAEEAAQGEGLDLLAAGKLKLTFSGKIVFDDQPSRPDVIGVFVEENGQSHLLKSIERADLVKALKASAGKKVSVQGKLQNKGKYIVIHDIVMPEAATPQRVWKSRGI